MTLPTGTVTFLFTDIEGSTKLSQLYRDAMPALLARHNQILHQAIEAHNGYVFQVVGDSFAAAFHSASDAIHAAMDAQRALQTEAWSPAVIKVRMGIHTGAAQLQDSTDNPYIGYATIAASQRVMSAGYGGQVLLSGATRELVRNVLPPDTELLDLGEKRLKDLLQPEHIYQLNIADFPSTFPPLKTLDSFANNLPLQLTSFIGREKEIEQIKKRLEKNRLVTLTGSGGVGKTRLSIQVASVLLESYPNGAWLVELAPLTDPSLVTQTVCITLGVTPQGNTPLLNVLTDYLKLKNILLVIDNCEHLIDACAQLCDSLLHTCPNLRIIASSREALGIEGENAYRVPSLSLPDSKSGLQAIEESEAVKLFMERATTLLPEFEITEANVSSVVQICQRLDGIALAIELAAVRVKMLKVEQIAGRLDDVFRLLTGGSRTALPRQQTLRALIDWSYNLLSDEERTALRGLSVFMGGWTLEAAEAVCDNPNMLDLLTHLVDKSLVAIDREHGDEVRYYLLETIRQYAREKLVESTENKIVREQHARWCVELAEHAEPKLRGYDQIEWLDRMEQEHDNLRVALEWSFNNNVDFGLRIANSLIWFWDIRDHALEGLQCYEKLLATNPLDPSPLHARSFARASWVAMIARNEQQLAALSEAGVSMSRKIGDLEGLAFSLGMSAIAPYFRGEYGRALPLAEEAIKVSEEAGIKWFKQRIISAVGYISQAQGNYEQARASYQESLALSREHGDITFIAFLLSLLGSLSFELGHYEQAMAYYQEDLSVARKVKNRNLIAEALQSIGEINIMLGQYPQAKVFLEESFAVDREVGNYRRQAIVLHLLGRVAYLQNEYEQAVKLYMESMQLSQRNNWRTTLAWCLVGLAEITTNHPKKAARLLGAAEAAPEVYISIWPFERIELEKISSTIQTQLDKTVFKTEYEIGRQMSLDEAVAYALKELG